MLIHIMHLGSIFVVILASIVVGYAWGSQVAQKYYQKAYAAKWEAMYGAPRERTSNKVIDIRLRKGNRFPVHQPKNNASL